MFHRSRREELTINLTPLIDVVFLLLIFFMVSTSFTRDTQISLKLPTVVEGEVLENPQKPLEISIDINGNYYVNGRALVNNSEETLAKALNLVEVDNNSMALIISADAKTPYQTVVTAMDVAGKQGFSNINLATKNQADQ